MGRWEETKKRRSNVSTVCKRSTFGTKHPYCGVGRGTSKTGYMLTSKGEGRVDDSMIA